MRTIKILLAAGFLLVFGTSIHAQVQRNETYLPKFAIKTNALYWATSTPNLGIEVGLARSAGITLLALRTFQRKFLRFARTLRRNECQQSEYIRNGT